MARKARHSNYVCYRRLISAEGVSLLIRDLHSRKRNGPRFRLLAHRPSASSCVHPAVVSVSLTRYKLRQLIATLQRHLDAASP